MTDTLITIMAWFTIVGLPILGLVGIWFLWRKFFSKPIDPPAPLKDLRYAWTAPPPDYVEPETTTTTTADDKVPEWTSIDEQSFMEDGTADVDCHKIVDPGTRVWRIYRSPDGIHWLECDPALTERAAANYADYIKRSNPEEYVRCNDPNGVILFYE